MLIQNFRPGTIDKMGFGYETLKALNPGIIMINVSAYGSKARTTHASVSTRSARLFPG